ncbi:hypothetical protein D3C79_966880 [compost metagenome]
MSSASLTGARRMLPSTLPSKPRLVCELTGTLSPAAANQGAVKSSLSSALLLAASTGISLKALTRDQGNGPCSI